MNLSNHEQKSFDSFLLSINSIVAGYGHASFSYLAIKQGNDFILSQGRLHLLGVPLKISSGYFESPSVKAGHFKLDELGQTPKSFLEHLLTGDLPTPHGKLKFPATKDQSYSLYFNSFDAEGIQAQRRQMQLSLTGDHRSPQHFLEIDWELQAAQIPFDSVEDLCAEYAVGPIKDHNINVQVAAHNVAAIDTSSIVKEGKAMLALFLTDGLDQNKASIGFRLFDKNIITKREQISGAKLKWSKADLIQRGSIEIDVPSGAILHCYANYAGEAHHYFWVTDPTTAQNPRRAVHQAFDDNMDILQDLLKIQGKGINARDFESAIAWIFWMLGFNVTHIGGTVRTGDALDLVATTPQGHFLLVECTTGLLKAENKLANLIDRAEKVRRSLVNSGNSHLKILPVIVTNKTREEVKVDLEQAEKLGILVVTREKFPELINFTHVAPDPEQLYKQAEEKIQRAQKPPDSLFGNFLTTAKK